MVRRFGISRVWAAVGGNDADGIEVLVDDDDLPGRLHELIGKRITPVIRGPGAGRQYAVGSSIERRLSSPAHAVAPPAAVMAARSPGRPLSRCRRVPFAALGLDWYAAQVDPAVWRSRRSSRWRKGSIPRRRLVDLGSNQHQ